MFFPINSNMQTPKGERKYPAYTDKELGFIDEGVKKIKDKVHLYQYAKNTSFESQALKDLIEIREEVAQTIRNNFSKNRYPQIPELLQQIDTKAGYTTALKEDSQPDPKTIEDNIHELQKRISLFQQATPTQKDTALNNLMNFYEQIQKDLEAFGSPTIASTMEYIDAQSGYGSVVKSEFPATPSRTTAIPIQSTLANSVTMASNAQPLKSLRQVAIELHEWSENSEKRRDFYQLLMGFIATHKIKNIVDLRTALSNFLKPSGVRDAYFLFGLDKNQLEQALNIIGSPAPIMDKIDISYINLINYRDTIPSSAPLLLKAINNLISFLKNGQTNTNLEADFTKYLNGDFINDYNQLPAGQKIFFNNNNLPDWLLTPPTNLQEMEKNLKIWSGDNVFKNNFYNAVQSFIDEHHIQTLQDFQKQIPNFLTDSDFRNIYFKYSLNQTELENAFTIMGGGIELPPMENLDISYTNLSNYLYNPPLPPSPLSDAVNNLVGVLSIDQKTLTEDQFTFYLNIRFRSNQIYTNIPMNQRGFFNIKNIPEWQSDFQAVEYQLKAMFNDSKGGNIFYNNLLSFQQFP